MYRCRFPCMHIPLAWTDISKIYWTHCHNCMYISGSLSIQMYIKPCRIYTVKLTIICNERRWPIASIWVNCLSIVKLTNSILLNCTSNGILQFLLAWQITAAHADGDRSYPVSQLYHCPSECCVLVGGDPLTMVGGRPQGNSWKQAFEYL